MKKNKLYFLTILLFFSVLANAQTQGTGITIDKSLLWFNHQPGEYENSAKPVSQFPPFCGKKLRNKGNTLSLPFGTGIRAFFMEQDYTVSDLQMFNSANSITATADTIYQNTVSGYSQFTVRPDFWLMSFLNIYGIIGFTRGKTNPNLTVPYIVVNIPGMEPIIIDKSVNIKDELTYDGPTYGGGATISAGLKSFFFVIDYNYTVTDPNEVYDKIYTQSVSPKFGVFLGNEKKKVSGTFWAGSNYIKNDHSFTGQISVGEIVPELVPILGETAIYSGTITAVSQWNMVLGGSINIVNHHYLSAEIGFIGRKQLMLMYDFRF